MAESFLASLTASSTAVMNGARTCAIQLVTDWIAGRGGRGRYSSIGQITSVDIEMRHLSQATGI